MQTQSTTTQAAKRPAPPRSAPKPRRKPSTDPALHVPSAAEAEGIVLRMAHRLDAGAGNHAEVRFGAREILRGITVAWSIIGLFDDARRADVNAAVDVIMGTTTPAPVEATALGMPDGAPADSATAPAPAAPKGGSGHDDALYDQAVALVRRERQANVYQLTNDLSIGHTTALKLIERMEAEGIVAPPDMFGTRVVVTAHAEGAGHV